MSKVVIKRTISLDFLGDDYKDAYLVFESIPLREFDQFVEASKGNDEQKANNLVVDTLKNKFVGGKFPDEDGKLFDLTKDDVLDFDVATAIKVFKILTGQDNDPKA